MGNKVQTDYDLIVIGAGIHGAGAAQAAVAAGYRVLVLEKQGVAAGTSSKSSKLIHGGLRYLESLQLSLVRECLRERSILLKIAPGLVSLKPFYIPLYKDSQRSAPLVRTGLCLYSLLAGLSADSRFQSISSDKWDNLNGLKTRGLKQVFRYFDAQTDDALLTQAVLHSAQSLGAELLSPATLEEARLLETHCELSIRQQQRDLNLRCGAIINCCGPWTPELLTRFKPRPETESIEYVQGTHLLLDVADIHQWRGIYYLEAPRDKRAIFAMPWKEKLLLGTTETPYRGPVDQACPLQEEVVYLLETLYHYFPGLKHDQPEEAIQQFCGLRVLPGGGDSPFSRSRETLFWHTHPRALSVLGGKLTTYRATSERALDALRTVLPPKQPVAHTQQLILELP